MTGPSVFHEDNKFFKSDTFESDTIFVTFEIFGKCSETFENYKNFVPVEVQSLCRYVLVNTIRAVYLHAYT